MNIDQTTTDITSQPATDFLSSFITPTEYTCKDIDLIDINYRLNFLKGPFRYIIRIPNSEEETFNWEHLDKITTVLQLHELDGYPDGIYTWILCDFGDISTRQFFVKKNINISEIGTKHSNILKDICLNKHIIDRSSSPNPLSVRVYFAGELSKNTNSGHITYDLNFLSGSYSEYIIDPVNFPIQLEDQLKSMFGEGLCGDDIDCLSNHTINISRTTDTIIKLGNEPVEKFEYKLLEAYGYPGAKIYKFDTRIEKHVEDIKRMDPYAKLKYKFGLEMLDRIAVEYRKEGYYRQLEEINKFRPLTEEEEREYLLQIEPMESIEQTEPTKTKELIKRINSGGKKSLKCKKTNKSKKSKKYKKSKKSKKSKRLYHK